MEELPTTNSSQVVHPKSPRIFVNCVHPGEVLTQVSRTFWPGKIWKTSPALGGKIGILGREMIEHYRTLAIGWN